jgi:hypothetical protein
MAREAFNIGCYRLVVRGVDDGRPFYQVLFIASDDRAMAEAFAREFLAADRVGLDHVDWGRSARVFRDDIPPDLPRTDSGKVLAKSGRIYYGRSVLSRLWSGIARVVRG